MKIKQIIGSSILLLSLLTGCQNISQSSTDQQTSTKQSENSSTSEEQHTITKSLEITSLPTKTEYYLYEKVSFSGLVITQVTNTDGVETKREEITDYVLKDENDNILTDGYQILSVPVDNSFNIYVTKEGCEGDSFNFVVEDVSNYSQTLNISSNPKTNYSVNDTFSDEGLQVYLTTSYYINKKKKSSAENITDYTLKIKNDSDNTIHEAQGYVFATAGDYTLIISYQGTRTELSTNLHLIAFSDDKMNNVSTLPNYDDDTITFSTLTTKMEVEFTNDEKELDDTDKGYYAPSEVVNKYNVSTYRNKNAYGWHLLPSTGDVPLLVVPVVTPGDSDKATSANWNKIFTAFFGKSNELNFESVHSYYYRSSYKKLNLKGGVTEFFDPSTVDSKYSTISGYTQENIASLTNLAVDWAKTQHNIDMTKYDSDGDGYVDGVWLIYLRDYTDGASDNFWAYTSCDSSKSANKTNPVANNYAWASLKFLSGFAASMGDTANSTLDAHVMIHETGHMLGLSDYYSYGNSSYAPTGNIDMMAYNVGDQNAYSKILLGWVTPYIIYGSTGSIKIPSSLEEDAIFVIPYDSKTYQKDTNGKIIFNAYDEYLVLEYYSDKDLNAQDYKSYYASHVQGNGGRLYHVDARLGNYDTMTGKVTLISNPDDAFTSSTNYTALFQVISNSESGSRAESAYMSDSSCNKFDEIRWISADKRYLSATSTANTSSLFKAGNEFKIENYASSFNKTVENSTTYYMNCKQTFSTSFKIQSIA